MQRISSRRIIAPAMTIRLTILVLVTGVVGCASAPAEDSRAAAERYQAVIASPVRTDQDRRMDASRHPLEFLPLPRSSPACRCSMYRPVAATRRSRWRLQWLDRQGVRSDPATGRNDHQASCRSAAANILLVTRPFEIRYRMVRRSWT
jgi:hypothetical protein